MCYTRCWNQRVKRPARRTAPKATSRLTTTSSMVGTEELRVAELLHRSHSQTARELLNGRSNLGGCDRLRVGARGWQARSQSIILDAPCALRAALAEERRFLFPVSTDSITEARIFGTTQVNFAYSDTLRMFPIQPLHTLWTERLLMPATRPCK
jgi:hypothetical protein